MKTINIFLLLLSFFLCFSCSPQEKEGISSYEPSDNNTIVNANSSWAILSYGLGSWNVPCNVTTQYVYFGSDSIINEYTYKKLFSCNDKLHENIKYEGLIREQNKKTYFIPANFETEYLLYDFSLEKGMTFEYIDPVFGYELPTESFYVKQVDFVEINGEQKKRIQLTGFPPYDDYVYATWIENIGSLKGLFYPTGMVGVGAGRELLCYYQNNDLIYKNPVYPECYYDKPEEIITFRQPDIGVSVYPNPVETHLNISSPNEIILSVKLVDISADKIVYNNENVNTNTFSIDVSDLQNGFYALSVWLNNGIGADFIIFKTTSVA